MPPGQSIPIPDEYKTALVFDKDIVVNAVQNPGMNNSHKYKYFQDKAKKWPFFTNDKGATLLLRLFEAVSTCANIAQQRIIAVAKERVLSAGYELTQEFLDEAINAVDDEGDEIYSEKRNLKQLKVTWAQNEYDHPGFQKYYIQLKSVQRFTETYALCQRLHRVGYFSSYIEKDKASSQDNNTNDSPSSILQPFISISLGGGPAFELLAVELFLKEICPHTPFVGISLDVAPLWSEYAERLGYYYIQWSSADRDMGESISKALSSIYDGIIVKYPSLTDIYPSPSSLLSSESSSSLFSIDFTIVSYAWLMYMSADWQQAALFSLLDTYHSDHISQPDHTSLSTATATSKTCISLRNIIISERVMRLGPLNNADTKYNIKISRLVSHDDDRQLLIFKASSDGHKIQSHIAVPILFTPPHHHNHDETYPNVPYQEHRNKKYTNNKFASRNNNNNKNNNNNNSNGRDRDRQYDKNTDRHHDKNTNGSAHPKTAPIAPIAPQPHIDRSREWDAMSDMTPIKPVVRTHAAAAPMTPAWQGDGALIAHFNMLSDDHNNNNKDDHKNSDNTHVQSSSTTKTNEPPATPSRMLDQSFSHLGFGDGFDSIPSVPDE